MPADDLKLGVSSIADETSDIRSFILQPIDDTPLPAFSAGSHIDVHVAPGITRQYSLCNGPQEQGHYHIAVKREPNSRGGSQAMFERIRPGDLLKVGTPRNNFSLQPSQSRSLLVAGGIGITPLLSMAKHLLDADRKFELVYFSRSIANTAFHQLLSSPLFAGSVIFHYALEPDAVKHYLRKKLWHHDGQSHLYLCGPAPFMQLVEDTAATTWPPHHVHLEHFSADPLALAGERRSFVVRLARSGIACEVSAQESIVDALSRRGVEIMTSCEQGVCGTCLTGVISGVPDHRDVFLTDQEKGAGDKMCLCVSRASSSELVLDL